MIIRDAVAERERNRAYIARDEYYEFIKAVFPLVGQGREYVDNWHVKELCDLVQSIILRLINYLPVDNQNINVPPGSLKSTIFSKGPFAWGILHDPSFSHMGLSYAERFAIRDSLVCREIIQSPWYQKHYNCEAYERDFGHRVMLAPDQNQKMEFKTPWGGKRYAAGITGSITAEHTNLLTVDDANSPHQAESSAHRKTVHNIFSGTLTTRFKSKTSRCIMNIQQRIDPEDASGYLFSIDPHEKVYKRHIITAHLNENTSDQYRKHYVDGLFFPSEFSEDYLNRQKSEMGSTKYNNQFEMLTSPPEGKKIKLHWFGWYDPQLLDVDVVNFDIDTAFGEKEQQQQNKNRTDQKGAYSAILAHCLSDNRKYLNLLNMSRNRLNSPRWRKHMAVWVQENGYSDISRIRIEPKANGQSQIDEMKHDGIRCPGYGFKNDIFHPNLFPDKTKSGGKLEMLENATVKLELGRVRLPGVDKPMPGYSNRVDIIQEDGKTTTTKYVPAWVVIFLDECKECPGPYWDQIDTMLQAIRNELKSSKLRNF